MEDQSESTDNALGSAITSARGEAVGRFRSLSAAVQGWLGAHERLSAIVVLIREVVWVQGQNRTSLAAAGAAFWLIIALFPAVITVVSLFGLIVSPEEIAKAVSDLGDKGQGSLATLFSKQAQQLSNSPVTSLSISLIVSLLVTLWSVSNGSYNLVRAIRLSFGASAQTYLKARSMGYLGGIVGVISLGVLALVSSAMTSFDDELSGFWQFVVDYCITVPVMAAAMVGMLTGLYRFALGHWTADHPLLPGAVLATAALFGLAWLFTSVVSTFGSTSAVYGVAAGSVSALLTVYVAIYVVLLGAIVNAQWPTRSLRTLFTLSGS
ncbi:MAG: YihY/virulence factor BrkB family protein [Actinomycetes bacterium]